jgi:hypothetical protein
MVFDSRLKLLFPPTEFKNHTGGTYAFTFQDTRVKHRLFVTRSHVKKSNQALQVFRFDETGKDTVMKEFTEFLPDVAVQMPLLLRNKMGSRLICILVNGEVFLYDAVFKPVSRVRLDQQVSHITSSDLDLDGKPERLVSDYVMNTLTVYRDDFSHPATVKVEFSGLLTPVFSLKKNGNAPPEISMCSGYLSYLLACRFNPWWPARWAFWAAIWLGVFLFSLLIRRTTRMQVERRYAAGKRITELQLKIVRNQMDPHFTMNALNAVVEAIGREEKEKARENLLHFSQMYRSLVLSADKIKRTLQEEIDFTESYLALERFRVGGQFSYSIMVDQQVDRTKEVPKMVIQSAVENAVKHGIRMREGGGVISIRAWSEDHKLILEITDNGIGRAAAERAGTTSTGRGTEIMAQFFELYHRVTGVKVQSEINDLLDEAGNAAGTRVKFTICQL